MLRALTYLIVILFLFLTVPIQAQVLPPSWEGKWTGTVDIWAYNQKTESFPMSLEIAPRGTGWDYIIDYQRDPERPDVRKYQLIVIDSAQSRLAIDEKNGIILDAYFNDDCLYTRFGGMNSDLIIRMCMENGVMDYEIISNFSDPIRVSGGYISEQDTMPKITSYNLYHFMKAKLKKEN
ncbi:MAG: hypothetical protein AAFY70_03855 [Bacteroidota bacterium]